MLINYKKIFLYVFFTIGILCAAVSHHLVLLSQFFLSETVGNFIFYFLWGVFAFVSYRCWRKCLYKDIFVIWIIWTLFIMLSVLFCGREQDIYFFIGLKSIMWFFPLFILGVFFRSFLEYIDNIVYLLPTLFNLIIIGCFVFGISGITEAASQDFGYDALAGGLIALGLLNKQCSVLQIFNVLVSFYCIILCGERGPLMSFIIILMILVIRKLFINKKNILVGGIFLLIGGVWLLVQYEYIINIIVEHIFFMGTSTHTLRWFVESNLSLEGESRINIYLSGLESLKDHIFVGLGAFNDRIYMYDVMKLFLPGTIGSYPHNIFLEWCMQFGAIPGIMGGSYFLYLMYKSYIKCDDGIKLTIFFFLVGVGFLPLLVSRSYIEHRMFWVLLGYLLSSRWFYDSENCI